MDSNVTWTDNEHALWRRLQAHAFEHPGQRIDFTARLMREQGWSRAVAAAAIEEYRRFCFLAIACGHAVTPGLDVDEVWHLHLTDSRDYWNRFCPDVLGMPLHHVPSRGDADDRARHRRQYADTLASYQHYFGAPPERFWPSMAEQFAARRAWQRVDLRRYRVRSRRVRSPRIGLRDVAWVLLFAVAPVAAATPLDWNGPAFLKLYALLLLAGAIGAVVVRRRLRAGDPRATPAALSTAQVAYLAGGEARVVDSSIATLLADNVVRWSATQNRLELVQPDIDRLESPLDAVARQIGAGSRIPAITQAITPILLPQRAELERRGLLLDPDTHLRIRAWSAAPLLVVAALGAAKIYIGIARDRPVEFLVMLTLVALVLAVVVATRPLHRTRAGDRALRVLRVRHTHAARAPRERDLGMGVAIAGTAVLAGTAFAPYHAHRTPAADSSGSSSNSSNDSGGDSGDSGGGCGGCGGGGGD